MGKSYSQDLRERIVNDVVGGMSARGAAKKYDVSASTAIRYVKNWHTFGHYRPAQQGRPARSILDLHEEWLCAHIEEYKDTTLEEMRVLLEDRGLKVGYGTLWHYLDRLGYSYKKNGIRYRTGTGGRGCGTDRLEGMAGNL